MSIRQIIDRHQRGAIVFMSVSLAICAVFIIYNCSGRTRYSPSSKAFYSDDDGETYFVDDLAHIAPFDHDGKTAYRAFVFQCDQPVVGYLMRYDPAVQAKVGDRMKGGPQTVFNDSILSAYTVDLPPQIKQARDKSAQWISLNAPESSKITDVKCKDGSSATPLVP